MTKKITFLITAALMLLTMIVSPGRAVGQTKGDITWTAAEQGYTNQQVITSVTFDSNVSGSFNKGTNNNAPKYYTSGTAIRCYGGNYFTISSSSTLTAITISFGSSDGSNAITTDVGTYNNGSWTGSANSVTFTIGGTTGNRRIAGFSITYSSGGTPTVVTPAITPNGGNFITSQEVSISCTTEDVTIYYTLNGNDPTVNSTQYTSPFTITETTTVKAFAVKNGYNNSNIATAEFTKATAMTIAEVRAQQTGDVFTTGIVTSCVGTTGYIQDATAAICVYGASLTVGNEISVSGSLQDYNGLLEITSPQVAVISSGNVVDPEVMTVAEAVSSTNQGWYIRIENATVTAINGSNTTIKQEGNTTIVVRGISGVEVGVNDIISLNGNIGYYNANQIANPQNVTVQEPTEPTITLSSYAINAPVEGADGVLTVTYENITDVAAEVWFCNAAGDDDATYDWVTVEINTDNNVEYLVEDNDGAARTAYFKVWAYDDDLQEVYSNLVTINQAEYVAPTYAELPFSFNGGRADIAETDGLYQEGLGSDYGSSPKLKFDGTGDWLLLQFNEKPGILTFDIKNNSFSGGTFTVQTSVDGVAYTDLENYTTITGTQNESFDNLSEDVRYIKWIYTEKVNGNVGLGNIILAKHVAPQPSITAADVDLTYDATGGSIAYTINNGVSGGTLTASTESDWLTLGPVSTIVPFTCSANTTAAARTATVTLTYTYNAKETVTKDVTVTQAAAPAPTFTVSFAVGDGGTFEPNSDFPTVEENKQAGTYTLPSATKEGYTFTGWNDGENTYAANVSYTVSGNVSFTATYTEIVDYATLPFAWEGGTTSAFNALNGTSTNGVGDYGDNQGVYRMKLDNSDDYIQVKTNEQPGIVTIGVKMVGGASTSTITVKGSTNGETFDDGEALEISGSQNDELTLTSTRTFDENVRYVRMVFTKGSNVGVGPITIAQVDHTPSITLSAYTIDATAEETDGGLTVTYKNIETSLGVDIHWFESTTSTAPLAEAPEWIDADFDSDLNVEYLIDANTGDARTTYFRVYGLDGDANAVYSDLVTVTQAAYNPPVTGNNYVLYTGNLVEGDYLIVYNDGAMNNTVTSGRLQYVDVTEYTNNNVIITDNATIVWHIAQSGDYWTIYSADANAYAASTGEKNKAQMLVNGNDDKAKWTITGTETYDFVNKANADANVNAYLRKNGTYGYACYAEGTGGSLSLYKKTELGKTFTATEGNAWNNPDNWTPAGIPTAYDNVFINGSVIINNGVVATANIVAGGTITIENGGQLIHNNAVNATLQKNITAWTTKDVGGWYFIASPVHNFSTETLISNGTGHYDLFAYDEPTAYWRSNTGTGPGSAPFDKLERGKGYLYANESNVTLNFAGEMVRTDEPFSLPLSYACTYDDVKGFNLVGNPYTCNIMSGNMLIGSTPVLPIYVINDEGRTKLTAVTTDTYAIKPGEGFFVQATATNQTLTINPTAKDNFEFRYIKIVAGNENGYDNAFIQLEQGNTLRKMDIAETTSVYVMNDGDDYAAARVEELAGTMPVHFKAVEDGEFTITINAKNIEASTMMLFDNQTGELIDLLETPTYAFKASAEDDDNRFKLIFDFNNNYNGVDDNYVNGNFAYQNGDELFVSGDGTLQVFDVMGRFVMSKEIHGSESVSVSAFETGVYMLRFVGENIMTQKIIVR